MLNPGRMLMRFEFMRDRQLLYMNICMGGALLLAILVGGLGPRSYVSSSSFAYNCPEETGHLKGPCEGGVALGNSSSTFVVSNPDMALNQLNLFLGIAMGPYSLFEGRFRLLYNLSVRGLSWQGTWENITSVQQETMVECKNLEINGNQCAFQTIVEIPKISHRTFEMSIRVTGPVECSGEMCPADWLRDVQFTAFTIGQSYSRFHLGFKIVGVLISAVMFSWYVVRMRNHWFAIEQTTAPATPDQKWLAGFLFVLVLANDPFFGARIAWQGWFLDTLATLFDVAFEYTLLVYWLITAGDSLRQKNRPTALSFYLPRFILPSIWALLNFIAVCWLRVRHIYDPLITQDPVFNKQIYPMLIVSEIIYFLIVVWMTYMVITTWEDTTRKYLFIAFPTFIYITSNLINMFSGLSKSIYPSSISFLYFFVLRNVYLYVLLYGFWPIKPLANLASNPIGTENPGSEGQSLLGSHRNPFRAQGPVDL